MDLDALKDLATHHLALVQILLFTVLMFGLWAVEQMFSTESLRSKLRHSMVNGFLVAFVIPFQWVANVLAVLLTQWEASHHWGLVYLLPDPTNPWIRYVLMFFAMDCLEYWGHCMMHEVPVFWRLHSVHHTDERIDVSTTLREHPGETCVRNLVVLFGAFMFGAPLELLLFRQTLQTFTNIFSHFALLLPPLPARIIGWVFVTPNLHLIHHHARLPYTNRNYGDVLSIWDRLFGTLAEHIGPVQIGLDTYMDRRLKGPDLLWSPIRPPQALAESTA